jgi:hypothetical protein
LEYAELVAELLHDPASSVRKQAMSALSRIDPHRLIDAEESRFGAEDVWFWHFARGTGYASVAEWRQAVVDFEYVTANKPSFLDGHIALIAANLAGGDGVSAGDAIRAMLREFPAPTPAQFSDILRVCTIAAPEMSELPNIQSAAGDLVGADSSEADRNSGWGLWGATLLRIGRTEDAVLALERAVKLHTARTRSDQVETDLLWLAAAYQQSGAVGAAESITGRVLEGKEFLHGVAVTDTWVDRVWLDRIRRFSSTLISPRLTPGDSTTPPPP